MSTRKETEKNQPLASPPRWAEHLLTWYCKPQLLEDLQGDLNEYFDRNLRDKGARYARLIYIIDVLKFFRLYTVRKPKFINLLIQWIMLGSYLKTSGRSIMRYKLFSSINIVGLAISMSVGLLMIAFIFDLLSYDDFHEKKDRIYRIISTSQYLDYSPNEYASTSVRAGKKIQEAVPGLEDMVILERGFGEDAYLGDKTIALQGFWASGAFFKIFTFSMLKGDAATALKEPYSLVLTENTAKKLFGSEEAFGRSVKFKGVDYLVTGIMKDPPVFSHMKFEVLVSFSTKEIQEKNNADWASWSHISDNYVYILLSKNIRPEIIQANLDALSTDENVALENSTISLTLQPLDEIALGKGLSNQIGIAMPDIIVWVLGSLAFIVILSACFNYTNLSIARSLRRSREVGIRKVMGATKSHVLGQFIIEAMTIAFLAFFFSFILFLFLRFQFLSLNPQLNSLVSLNLSFPLILYFIVFTIAVGIIAGFLPALFFSRINALQVLKNVASVKVFRHVNMRKALILIQYTFSLIFIASTIIGYEQYKHFLTFDLGFSTANILNISLQGNNPDLLVKELQEIPAVTALSKSSLISSVGNNQRATMKYNDPLDSASVNYNIIDENYLALHEHKLIAGKNFTPKTGEIQESEVIVNEQLLKRFNIGGGNPGKALGEIVTMKGKNLEIIGVVKDFHHGGVHRFIEPFAFRHTNEDIKYINAKVTSADWPSMLVQIEKAWRKIDTEHPFEARLYDDEIEQAYNDFSAMIKIIGFLAFLAISIASLGLFGMVVFTTETRLKEIGIRKVNGADELNLIYLLSKGFLFLLTISALIGLPATYFFFDKVVLTNIAYRKQISLDELLAGVSVVMIIAFFMIASQTLKAARTNPAHILKNE